MNPVLVTGATGFTGKYVVAELQRRGFEVRGLSSADMDIRDASSVRDAVAPLKPTHVVHLAGTPNVPDSEADRAFSVNVQGTVNLLEACGRLTSSPKKILLASSSFVYGDTGKTPAGEDSHLAPTGAYGKSKLEMERAASRWFGRLPVAIVRPFNYTGIGHGERFLVPKLVSAFRERLVDASFVDPNAVRDYSDVRWIANVYADLLACPDDGMTINVCSGVGTPLSSLVEMLETLTERRASRAPAPADLNRRSALVGSPKRLLDLVRAPSPYSLRDTLRWMLG